MFYLLCSARSGSLYLENWRIFRFKFLILCLLSWQLDRVLQNHKYNVEAIGCIYGLYLQRWWEVIWICFFFFLRDFLRSLFCYIRQWPLNPPDLFLRCCWLAEVRWNWCRISSIDIYSFKKTSGCRFQSNIHKVHLTCYRGLAGQVWK